MRRLGLDIGTNSIGWCLIEGDSKIVDIGVRIFADGRDPKSGASLAIDRRAARAMRRRRDRYLGRRSAFLRALVEHGLMPVDTVEAKLTAERDPYKLRARALHERLDPHEIGRAFFHLNQRRGFKSNRKAERRQKDNEDGKIAGGAKALDQAMAEVGADTLGQFLAGRSEKRVRMNGESQEYDFYPQRRHVEYEFARIWEAQAAHHPELLSETERAALHRILFFQRPLKEQEVGVCTFVTEERRLPKAHPMFQERRLYEEVNQLEITTLGEGSRKLTPDQRDALILELRSRKERSFDALARRLKLDPGQSFNKASETRIALRGNEVYAAMSDKKRFGANWAQLDAARQWLIVERLINEGDSEALHAFLTEECGLDDDCAVATAKAPLPEGYGRLGATATRLILAELKKDVVTYDEAVRRAFPHLHHSDFRTGEVLPKLPYYGELLTREILPGSQLPSDPPEKRWGKITNPTVHIGLRQLEKLVNAILAVHGRPDEIVVELARELKLSEKEKAKHDKRIREDTAAAVRRSEKLQSIGQPDTGANRLLLRMWEELNPANPLDRRCPYCGGMIGAELLFSGATDVDHILPYSRTLDDSASNKVVAHRACNRAKGNKTPFERWHTDTERWGKIAGQVARLHKSKQWRFGPDAMERFEKEGGFLARQLTDTQYLSRIARTYLSTLYADKSEGGVYVIPGRLTAMLRRLWALNSLLPDHNFVANEHSNAPKNRLDHRHHAIDATVVAVTTRGLLNEIAKAAGRAEEKNLDKMFEGLPEPWSGFREELAEKLARVIVSHKPDHGRRGRPARGRDVTSGRLHNDTAYGLTGETATDGKTPIVVHRVPLMSLKPADLTDPPRIPDQVLREALQDSTRGKIGKDFELALRRFAHTHPNFRGIRRVRVREPLNVIPIRDKNGRAYKAYKGDANARFDVWRLPNGKWTADIVSMFDAHQPDQCDRRPHPAAKKVLSLRQNDMLAVERNGGAPQIVRVVKFSTNGTIALAPDNEGGALKARDAASNEVDPFKYVFSSAGGLKNLKARQVRVDALGRVFDPGPREPATA
ncbi:type II CRISPR RNA-guided endonuclease Cas9 [Sphingomonas sp. LY54]|uniref:type II CRISPR RNA-guided endonuclease Cas9 n=1 Tax=Sphingomonas sp. LY54 TaxID=3095343 RepID=UPI002D770781|nr:type II CRISPR RNA-guided endonuclease Cas9 [Sphingomonas sp. LY54]WRP28713.1 type II CRISPR RNA-guided endonuclease Cas9 [Sphingomonas sp. LY54]